MKFIKTEKYTNNIIFYLNNINYAIVSFSFNT